MSLYDKFIIFYNKYHNRIIFSSLFLLSLYFFFLYTYAQRRFGWHGWFDQTQYLNELTAILNLDSNPSNYYYPPLYPLIGSFSFGFLNNYPFFLPNLVCFIAFFYYYFKFLYCYIGYFFSLFCICYCLYEVKTLMVHWAIPWTTTLVTPLLLYFFLNQQKQFFQCSIKTKLVSVQTTIAGLIFLTRPVDIIILVPSFLFMILQIFQNKRNRIINLLTISVLISLFIALLSIFNYLIFGTITGSYFTSTASNVGFYFPNIPAKFYSLFFDSNLLYNIEGQAIFQKIPILYLTIPSFIYGLIFGGGNLRLLIIGVLFQICTYISYSDFLPIGLWRFNNIHYFKFAIPIMIFLIFNMLKGFFEKAITYKNRLFKLLIVIIFSVPFYFAHIQLNELTYIWGISENNTDLRNISFQLKSNTVIQIEKIDFLNISGDFTDIYFGEHSVSAGGKKLTLYKDFRFIPLQTFGDVHKGVSLILIRPVSASELEISLNNLQLDSRNINFRVYSYSIRI